MKTILKSLGGALVVLTLVNISATLYGQGQKPLTADDLIQMKKADFDDQTVINAIAAKMGFLSILLCKDLPP